MSGSNIKERNDCTVYDNFNDMIKDRNEGLDMFKDPSNQKEG